MKFSTGIKKEPLFMVFYGEDGTGKTTLAAQAPKCVIVGPEGGSSRIAVATRAEDIRTYMDLKNAFKWLRHEKHDFQSVAVDSLDWIEPLLWEQLCADQKPKQVENIEAVGGGFQKGYLFALDYWRDLIGDLQDLRHNRQMNVVAIAHEKVYEVNDPRLPLPYSRHGLKLHENKQVSVPALWREAADAVLFIAHEDVAYKVDERAKTAKSTGGLRKIYTERNTAYDAKNRFGLPPTLDFPFDKKNPLDRSGWLNLQAAIDAGEPEAAETVSREVVGLIEQFRSKGQTDIVERIEKAVSAVKGNAVELIRIRDHARNYAGEKAVAS